MRYDAFMSPRLFKTAAAWKAWLAKNGGRATEIWLAYFKKDTGKKSITYQEALDEALCYGWIDSIVRRLDAESYMQRWSPRKPTSVWSARNKARIAELTAAGRMAEPGLAAVRLAKKNGSWDKLTEIERIDRGGGPPDEVIAAIASFPGLKAKFEALPASKRKMLSYWVASAKRPETRDRRLAQMEELIDEDRLPGFSKE
jgi:uncharacterized protein YdeI (YjbR/CyaY-like superfamily)